MPLDNEYYNQSGLDNSSTATNLTFIDTNLTDYQSLIPVVDNHAVILINSQQNGIEQITEALAAYSNLDSISIFSHGDVASLQLGNTYLSNANLYIYQDDLAAWGEALSSEGDLLFYGCNVGAKSEGVDFVNDVANLTGADVAASNDLTGNFELGGDWTLEVVTGSVETQTFTLTKYGNLLAISQQDILNGVTADFNGDGKADLLRQEKGHWDDDNNYTANLFISTANGFDEIHLPENLDLKGDYTNLYLGDFNGDGKSDILRQEKGVLDNDNYNTANLLISNGTGFDKIVLSEDLWFHGDFNNLHIGDFNGDGKSDIFRQHKLSWDNDSSWVGVLYFSTGNDFIFASRTPASFSLRGDYTNLHVGDFNGDGKADLLRQEKNSFDNDVNNDAHLLISQDTSFQKVDLPADFNLHGDYTNLFVGDYNGDGKDDILRQEKSSWDNDNSSTANLLISNGNSFNKIDLPENLLLKGDYTNLFVGDYNGDGKDDIIRQEKNRWDNDNSNTANLLLSTGTAFNKIVLAEDFALGGDYTNIYTGDFSGDGKVDLIRQEKGWYNYNDEFTAQLLVSTGNNFNSNSIYGASLNGNFTNIITNNTFTQYLANNDTSGLKFNFTYDANVSWEQKKAFEFAGEMWSEFLDDDVTVNIHISMVNNSELPENTLGGAVPFFHQGTSYTDFKTNLSDDIDYNQASASGNNDDQTAVNNLDTGSAFQVVAPSDSANGVSRNFDQVAVTRANAKALGLIDSDDNTLDGTIVMNNLIHTPVSWQYDYFSDGVGTNKIDFTTVAMHEIGHTLGFVSVVDGLSNDNYQDQAVLNESVTALDLFRFLQGNQGVRDIRTVSNFFSLDGATNLARMSYGVNNIGGDNGADGYQGSHWNNEDDIGIMDPVLETNVKRQIGELDLQALDVIGWDRKFAANSWDVFASNAWNAADDIGNINRNVELDEMFQDWRWARRGSQSRLRQDGNIAQFLAQEGFFTVGAFRESFDFSSVNNGNHNSCSTGYEMELNHMFVLDSFKATLSSILSELDLSEQEVEGETINDETMLELVMNALPTLEISQLSLDELKQLMNALPTLELSQLSLDELRQLIEQQLVEAVGSSLRLQESGNF